MRYVVGEETCPRCAKCERWRNMPDYIRDPWLLWERFPCPPPGSNKARLLLQLDWTGQMGQKDGCKALRRVATRCNVDLTSVEFFPSSLSDCDELFTVLGVCGAQCVIAIILACICLIFVFILVIVCYRYVHRVEKPSSPTTTKVLTTDQTALNTQVNRYYVQSQYYYRAGNIPERRGLPYEVNSKTIYDVICQKARTTENGVEARLIKAIQQTPVHAYPTTDDMCSQCMHDSRQNTVNRARHRYEPIYWKDNLQKRVPSNDSLQRKQLDRHRSATGSSSDMSHYYDYISDNAYDTVSGRRSNHSTIYFPTNVSLREVPLYGDSRYSDDERGTMLPKFLNTELDPRNSAHRDSGQYIPNRESSTERCDKISCKGYISDPPRDSNIDAFSKVFPSTMQSPNRSNEFYTMQDTRPMTFTYLSTTPERNMSIKGYKYTYNPSFDEDTTTTATNSKPEIESSSPDTPSETFEFVDSVRSKDLRGIIAKGSPRGSRHKQTNPSFRSSKVSETTSLSDSSSRSNSINGHRNRSTERFNN